MELSEDRKEMLASLIARATMEASMTEEPVRIAVCMPPCMAMCGVDCPLCELVIVMPNGTTVRETKGH